MKVDFQSGKTKNKRISAIFSGCYREIEELLGGEIIPKDHSVDKVCRVSTIILANPASQDSTYVKALEIMLAR